MSNSLSFLKPFLTTASIIAIMVSPALAKPPVVHDDMKKALKVAANQNKLALIMLGRDTCSFCKALRKNIAEGEVSITADQFVMADLNADDPKVNAEFKARFSSETFRENLPYVVITDSKGQVLVSWCGGRKIPIIEKRVQTAKSRAEGKSNPIPRYMNPATTQEGEQNGRRKRHVWHLLCHRRFPLAVA